jgi:hypothetical protein
VSGQRTVARVVGKHFSIHEAFVWGKEAWCCLPARYRRLVVTFEYLERNDAARSARIDRKHSIRTDPGRAATSAAIIMLSLAFLIVASFAYINRKHRSPSILVGRGQNIADSGEQ